MKNITPPRMVSFETALQNLAARLTGQPAADLPKTQEALVQYMAENVPSVDELAEAVTVEVLARLEAAAGGSNTNDPATGAEGGQGGSGELPQTEDTPENKGGSEGGQDAATPKPKRTRSPKND